MTMVFLNGAFMAPETASVSVLDRGFLLGDGVYEVIPVYFGRLFRLDEHLQRLQGSLDAVRIANPLSPPEWQSMLEELVEKNGGGELSVYLQVTRGVAAHRDHAFPPKVIPTVFAMAHPVSPPDPDIYERGVSVVSLSDNRWQHCDIKAISLLPNVLLRQQAIDQGVSEAVLIRDGFVTEGAASNFFIVTQGVIKTPPRSQHILTGITRDLLIELARQHGLPCQEVPVSEAELRSADEVWLSSSTKEVVPVTLLDGKPVGSGVPGPQWRQMSELYRQYKQTLAS